MADNNAIPSFAPTSTTSYAPSNFNAGLYHQEITKASLIKSNQHKVVYDSLAEAYSIITVLEVIENSFLKDYITDKEKYTSITLRLINQYQMIIKGFENDELKYQILNDLFKDLLPNLSNLVDLIAKKFNLDTHLAISRLKSGIPATIEHLHTRVESHAHNDEQAVNSSTSSLNKANSSNKASARLVAEATGSFITIMDALKLNYKTKDQLHPLLSDLVVSLNDMVTKNSEEEVEEEEEFKPIEFQGKSKLVNWLIKLNNLQDEELSQDEINLFLKDLDNAYKGFYASLE